MTDIDLLRELGWPSTRMNELGRATWTGLSNDGRTQMRACIARGAGQISAVAESLGLEGSLIARVDATRSGIAPMSLAASVAGNAAASCGDALSIFRAMSKALGTFAFNSGGPAPHPAQQIE